MVKSRAINFRMGGKRCYLQRNSIASYIVKPSNSKEEVIVEAVFLLENN